MREIFVSTTFIKDKNKISKAIDILKKLKIKNIELGSNHCYEKSYDYLINKNLNYYLHNYFPVPKKNFVINIASLDDEIRNNSINQIKRSILFCKKINAQLFTFHPGFLTDPDGASTGKKNYDFLWGKEEKKISNLIKEKAWKNVVNSLKKIISFSKKHNVKISIETEGSINAKKSLLMQKPLEYIKFKKIFSPKEIGINLNLAHLNLASKAFKFDKLKFINLIKNYILAIELSHNTGDSDSHLPIRNNGWYIKFLKHDVLKNKPIILEFRNSSAEDIKSSIKILKNVC